MGKLTSFKVLGDSGGSGGSDGLAQVIIAVIWRFPQYWDEWDLMAFNGYLLIQYMGGSTKGGTPKWMVCTGKILLKWMI